MKTYAEIDLHSRNNYVGIIDEKDKMLYQRRLPNRLEDILQATLFYYRGLTETDSVPRCPPQSQLQTFWRLFVHAVFSRELSQYLYILRLGRNHRNRGRHD